MSTRWFHRVSCQSTVPRPGTGRNGQLGEVIDMERKDGDSSRTCAGSPYLNG
jgi:hypothetical protein